MPNSTRAVISGRSSSALGTDHVELRCSHDDIARVLPDVVWHAETPLLRTAPAPMYLLSQMVRDSGYKVVLTGEGADEVFGGYDIFKEAKIRRFWAKFPGSARRASLVKRLYPYLPYLQRQPAGVAACVLRHARRGSGDPCFSHLPRWRADVAAEDVLLRRDMRAAIAGYDGRAELAASCRPSSATGTRLPEPVPRDAHTCFPATSCRRRATASRWRTASKAVPFLDPRRRAFASPLPPSLKMKVLQREISAQAASRVTWCRAVSASARSNRTARPGPGVLRPRRAATSTICCPPRSCGATASSTRRPFNGSCRKFRTAKRSARRRHGARRHHLDATHRSPVHQPFRDGHPWNLLFRNCGPSSSITFSFGDESGRFTFGRRLIPGRGIVDSTGILELVCHLQERYGIDITDEELVPDNLDSVSKVARFVERKRQPQPVVTVAR